MSGTANTIRWDQDEDGIVVLTLDDPSVNLVKPEAQSWNVVPLVVSTIAGGAQTGAQQTRVSELPAIKIRGGRIDFKFGDTKSTFYVTNANVDITPRSSGSFDLDFEGEPARTDRTSQGFGSFRAKGQALPTRPIISPRRSPRCGSRASLKCAAQTAAGGAGSARFLRCG